MTDREYRFTSMRDRRQLLIGAGLAGGTLLVGRQFVTNGATPSPTPVPSNQEAPVQTAAGELDASPEASVVASPAASPTAVFQASMQSIKFIPPKIEISVGTTVVWTNNDSVAHTVTHRAKPEDQVFASPMLAPGDSFSFTFEHPGTYAYFCLPHPFMTGTVVVSE